MQELIAFILASSEGTDMKSSVPQYAHEICEQAMISYVIEATLQAGSNTLVMVLGQKSDQIKKLAPSSTVILHQEKDLGAGNAMYLAKDTLERNTKGTALLIPGNSPVIEADTLKAAYNYHISNENQVTVLSTPKGNLSDICFINIESIIELITFNEIKENINNYHTSDLIKKFYTLGVKVSGYSVSQSNELLIVNDRANLNDAEQIIQKRIIQKHMENGVTFHLPETSIINPKARIGKDTKIYPGTILRGDTLIGERCKVGPNSLIEDGTLGDDVQFMNSVMIQSQVGNSTDVGPFAYIRPGSRIGEHIRIGDFVEIKNAVIGDHSKISHLTYVGDAEFGKNVNVGCGVITVNYDGKKKHKTIVGDNAFIGCNVNLVSPVVVKENAYIAAGSTITEEVPEYSLAIARSRQTIIADWVKKRGLDKK